MPRERKLWQRPNYKNKGCKTVCKNNRIRKLARVTRADRKIMVELREETGVQRRLTEILVRSRLQRAGHVDRMADETIEESGRVT